MASMIASRLGALILCASLLMMPLATATFAADAAPSQQTIAAHIAALEDPSQQTRDKAAEALRNAAASCGGTMPGDHDEAYWASKLQSIKIGMDKDAVEKIIPP